MLLRLRIWTFRYWAFLPNSPFLHNDSLCQDLTLAAEAEPSFLKASCNFWWKHSVQRKWAIFEITWNHFYFRNEHWTVHRHWECVCSGPGYSKHFQSAVEPHLFANLHTFWQFGYFLANLPHTFCGHLPKWNSWHVESRFLYFVKILTTDFHQFVFQYFGWFLLVHYAVNS